MRCVRRSERIADGLASETLTFVYDALNWLLGDHLGSTTITADSSGNRYGELRYKG